MAKLPQIRSHLRPIDSGESQTVLLLHGLAASHHDWDLVAPALNELNLRVFRPDLLGHGDNHKSPDTEPYTIDDLFNALVQWIEEQNLSKPFILIGHSLGGYLSLLLSCRYSADISRMVLVSPLFSPEQLHSVARYALGKPTINEKAISLAKPKLVNTILSAANLVVGGYSPAVRWQTALDYSRTAPSCLRIPASVEDLTPHLNTIQTPTLVIWGQYDLALKPSGFNVLVNSMPNVSKFIIPGCGHEPHKTHSHRLNRKVINYISEP